jgi:adenylate cyclase
MNDLIIDADGKSRRSLLSLEKDGQVILSLGTELALRYLSVEGIELEAVDPEQQRFQLGKTVLEPLKPNDGGYVEADTGGYQILMLSDLRYLGQGFQTISLSEVLAGKIPAGLMRDRIVIIGVTAASASDLFFVPRRNGWSNRSFLNASGVEIHADIANQLLDAALNQRLQIRAWSEPWEMFWIGLWCCLGASIPWMERHPRTRFWSSPQKPKRIGISLAALSLTSLGFGLATGSYFALQGGWWIPVMPALLGMTSSAIAVTVYLAHNASTMRQMFGRYLTDEVVANLLENPNRLKLGGEKRQVTLLVSDLRSFSAIAERLSPEASVVVINTYLEAMTEVINTYQGTINDFVGDGIFTIFGAPIQQADDTERAVACAIAMQRAMQSINQSINQNHQYQLTPLEMGIGLHTGEVLAGNIGSAKRAKYTVIGSEVNLAFRIESYTVGGQILASDRVINHCKAPVQTQRKLEVQLKGFHEAIVLYEVTGIGDRYNQFLPQQVEAMVSLQAEVPVRYQVLQDKRLLETNFEGQLLKLSNTQAELFTLCPINQLDNLKLNLLIDGTFTSDDLYAKVVEQVAEHHFWIRFTSIPPAIATQLKTLQQDNQTNLV